MILVLNAGSSSLRCALFRPGVDAPVWRAHVAGTGTDPKLSVDGEPFCLGNHRASALRHCGPLVANHAGDQTVADEPGVAQDVQVTDVEHVEHAGNVRDALAHRLPLRRKVQVSGQRRGSAR